MMKYFTWTAVFKINRPQAQGKILKMENWLSRFATNILENILHGRYGSMMFGMTWGNHIIYINTDAWDRILTCSLLS
jgi:hypothetical protein